MTVALMNCLAREKGATHGELLIYPLLSNASMTIQLLQKPGAKRKKLPKQTSCFRLEGSAFPACQTSFTDVEELEVLSRLEQLDGH